MQSPENVAEAIVRFEGPRMRDGRAVTVATIYETKLGPPPSDNAEDVQR